jgi:hypothetical protein
VPELLEKWLYVTSLFISHVMAAIPTPYTHSWAYFFFHFPYMDMLLPFPSAYLPYLS